jgi:hypothetical protein
MRGVTGGGSERCGRGDDITGVSLCRRRGEK